MITGSGPFTFRGIAIIAITGFSTLRLVLLNLNTSEVYVGFSVAITTQEKMLKTPKKTGAQMTKRYIVISIFQILQQKVAMLQSQEQPIQLSVRAAEILNNLN